MDWWRLDEELSPTVYLPYTHDALSTHTTAFMLFSQEREMLQENAILGSEACHGEDHDPLEEVKHEDCPPPPTDS